MRRARGRVRTHRSALLDEGNVRRRQAAQRRVRGGGEAARPGQARPRRVEVYPRRRPRSAIAVVPLAALLPGKRPRGRQRRRKCSRRRRGGWKRRGRLRRLSTDRLAGAGRCSFRLVRVDQAQFCRASRALGRFGSGSLCRPGQKEVVPPELNLGGCAKQSIFSRRVNEAWMKQEEIDRFPPPDSGIRRVACLWRAAICWRGGGLQLLQIKLNRGASYTACPIFICTASKRAELVTKLVQIVPRSVCIRSQDVVVFEVPSKYIST